MRDLGSYQVWRSSGMVFCTEFPGRRQRQWYSRGDRVQSPVLFGFVAMTLGDAFNRRKKLAADLLSWTGRLAWPVLSGAPTVPRSWTSDNAYRPDPGTEKASRRQYTVQE